MTAARALPGTRRAVALAVEHGVDDLYQGVVPALVPLLVGLRHYDYTRAGGIVLAATLMSSVAQPLFGVLADRRPMPWLRTVGLLLAAGGIGAVGLVDSYPAVWAAVLVSGLGVAAYHPEAARAVYRTATADRGMGWFTFGGLAGFAAGPLVAGTVLSSFGLGATVLLTLPALLVAALTAARSLRRRGPHRARGVTVAAGTVAAGTVGDATGGDAITGAATVEDRRGFGWLTAVVMTRSVLYYGLSAFLVVYLTTRLHAGPGTATLALTAFTGIGALSTLASSRVTRRFGRATTLLLCYVAAAGVLTVLLLVTRPVVAVGVAALLGVVLNIPVPVHTTLGQSYLSRHLGLASAVTLGLAVSTGGLATPVLGALADHHGITAAFAALLVLPALAAGLVLPLRHRPRPG